MEHWRELLEPLVGTRLLFDDYSGTVIEIQTEPPALIMRADDAIDAVQVDQLGRPQSMTTPTWTQPLTRTDSDSLLPALQRQLPLEHARAIQAALNKPSTQESS